MSVCPCCLDDVLSSEEQCRCKYCGQECHGYRAHYGAAIDTCLKAHEEECSFNELKLKDVDTDADAPCNQEKS